MNRYMVTYRKKSDRPVTERAVSTQVIEGKRREDIFPRLYERLHVTPEEFARQFEIVEIQEI